MEPWDVSRLFSFLCLSRLKVPRAVYYVYRRQKQSRRQHHTEPDKVGLFMTEKIVLLKTGANTNRI